MTNTVEVKKGQKPGQILLKKTAICIVFLIAGFKFFQLDSNFSWLALPIVAISFGYLVAIWYRFGKKKNWWPK